MRLSLALLALLAFGVVAASPALACPDHAWVNGVWTEVSPGPAVSRTYVTTSPGVYTYPTTYSHSGVYTYPATTYQSTGVYAYPTTRYQSTGVYTYPTYSRSGYVYPSGYGY